MKYFDKYIDLKEIKAEAFVSIIEEFDFDVISKGSFVRNLSDDLLSIKNYDNRTTIELARDGVFQLLPEGLFFEEDSLRLKKKNYKKLKEEKERVELFFQPFDTEYFKLGLELQDRINDISEKETNILIDHFFEISQADENNKYIKKIKSILPLVSEIRGNEKRLKEILENVFSAKVEIFTNIKEVKNDYIDESEISFNMKFVIHKLGLKREEYKIMNIEVNTFFDFFYKYFLPVEVGYEFIIKDKEEKFILGNTLILDYNTQL